MTRWRGLRRRSPLRPRRPEPQGSDVVTRFVVYARPRGSDAEVELAETWAFKVRIGAIVEVREYLSKEAALRTPARGRRRYRRATRTSPLACHRPGASSSGRCRIYGFGHARRGNNQGVSPKADTVTPVDEQQARLLERLREANGMPVSFDELRSVGIENPAVLCYELDLVGISIARVHRYEAPGHAVSLGVRIDEVPALEPSAAAHAEPPAPAPESWRRRVQTGRIFARAAARAIGTPALPRAGRNRRALALTAVTALIVAAAVSATLVITAPSGVRASARARAAIGARDRRDAGRVPAVGAAAASARAGAPVTAHPGGRGYAGRAGSGRPQVRQGARLSPEAIAAGSAAQLEARGHQLLGEGRYAAAIGVLHAALGVSGQSSAGCGQPGGESCLTYAYALYDLGRALRLDGDSQAAVGVLTKRLQIDNQRAAVRGELERAKASAGAGRLAEPTPNPAPVAKPVSHTKAHRPQPRRAHTEARDGGTLIVMP